MGQLLDIGQTPGTAADGADPRFFDARTPTAHKTSHQDGGDDELALAASQITSGQFAMARIASGTPTGTKFVRDDGALAVPTAPTDPLLYVEIRKQYK